MVAKKRYNNQTEELIDKLGGTLTSIGAALWRERNMAVQPSDVNFYDYDGTIVHSYSKKEFLLLDAMPGNPQHEGLTAQGWNWTLAGAQDYVSKYGACEIGQTYITDDGKTRLYIDIAETERLSVSLRFTQSAAGGVTIDWGDGQSEVTPDTTGDVSLDHTYEEAGEYLITMEVAAGCTVMLGQDTSAMSSDSMLSHRKSFVTSQYFGGRSPVVALEIGAGVNALGTQSLMGLMRMAYVTIPTNVVTLYYGVFMAVNQVKAIHLPIGVTHINGFMFRGCYSAQAITIPEGVLDAGNFTFFGCTHLKRAALPEGVTSIGKNCFAACYLLERAIFPDGVTSIGSDCFTNAYNLRTTRIPEGVTVIPARAFHGCHCLTGLTIPEGVTSIGESAFGSCYSFRTMTLPSTVTEIGMFAFLFCDGNEEVHIRATTPPELVSPTAFSSTGSEYKIYVPWSADHSVLAAYLAATNWCGKTNIYEEDAPDWYNETVDVTVEKVWSNTDESTTWPEGAEVTVQLLADGVAAGDPVTLDAENNSHVFVGLHKYSAENTEIVYSAEEQAIEGYTGVVGELTGGVITITNTQNAPEPEQNISEPEPNATDPEQNGGEP